MRINYFLVLLAILLTANGIAQNIPSYVPKDGLVAYYSFDNNLNDVVNGYTLSTSDASYQNGVKNNSFVFNGSQECYSTDLNFRRIFDNTNNWSVNFWFNSSIPYNQIQSIPTGYSNTEKMLFACDGENYYPYKRLWIQSRENKIWICRDGFDASASSYTDDFLEENTWYFVSVNYDGTGYKIYVDGKEKNLTQSGNLTLDLGNTDAHTEQVTIGGNRQNNVAEWKGSMDEVMVYNRVLSPNEVSALYKGNNIASTIPSYIPSEGLVGYWPFNGNANDESGNGNHGTVNGATLSSDRSGKANSAYSFDGSSNYIESNLNFSIKSGITFSCWGKITSLGKNDPQLYMSVVSGKYSGIAGVWDGSIINNKVFTIGGSQIVTSTTNFNLNTWVHLTYSYDQQTGISKFYQNGILQGTLTETNSITNFNLLRIGRHLSDSWGYGWYFNGQLDDIAIYNRALNEQEITALYTENNPCTSVPTINAEGPTTFVEGDTLILKTNNGAGHTFQWQKDSVAIVGATDSIYKVTTSGNYTVTITDQTGLCAATSDGELVTVTPKIIPSIPSYIPANGLVGYWPFNGNANDESGNGNHGTVNGATLNTDRFGIEKQAYNFNGISNWIEVQDANSLDITNKYTLSVWVRLPDYSLNNSNELMRTMLGKPRNTGGGGYSFRAIEGVAWNGNSLAYQAGWNTTVVNGGIGSIDTIPLTIWTNVIFTYDGVEGKLYKNGRLTNRGLFSFSLDNSSQPLYIGKEFNFADQINNRWFKGQLDDIAIYNRALTEQEITTLYIGCTKETATSSNFNSLLLSTGSSVSLSADPQGGVFTGASIDSNKFVPSKAKIGANKVQYNFKNSQGCNDSTLFTMIVADTVGTTCKKYDTITVTNNITKYDTVTVKNNVYDTVTVTNNVTKYDTVIVKTNVFDTVKVNTYDTITITNNITKYDTVIVPKTVTKYDTVKVNTYDTITVTNSVTKYDTVLVNKYDTITVTNNVTKYDTVIVPKTVTKYDTVKVNTYDTITVTNNVTKYDTVIVPKTVTKYDTVIVPKTVTKYDTVIVKNNVYDTVIVPKTITKYDTVKVNTYDTITVTNNVTKYDTVLVNKYDTITVTDTVSILKINFKLTTGIKANQMTSMSIYPNPTSDVLIIDASDLAAITGYSYRILDVLGKEVYNALVTSAKTEISLKTLGAKGMYVLHILDANKLSVQTKQIVLE